MLARYTRPVARWAFRAVATHARSSVIRPVQHGFLPSVHRSSKRSFATPAPQVKASDLSSDKYHLYSDATMERLLDSIETILDDLSSSDYEVEYSSGVLTLKLGDKGTYVINKQPPNKQIWLSSPLSGPKRYDYIQDSDDWIYVRESSSLGELLNAELSQLLEQDVDLRIRKVSKVAS
ncbi:unnamed protein product [Somion occarium]|uniref:ferroxidase n=2 Tax=Somion occarium TaxID=3059160 RepID=A0ABP1CLG0_9APHY